MSQHVKTYRNSVTSGASHLDLLIATYDAIADDLRLAGSAASAGDIAARCGHSQHAVTLLAHVESWIPLLNDAALENSLKQFYGFLRDSIVLLQGTADPDGFARLALHVSEARAAWHSRRTGPLQTMSVKATTFRPSIGDGESRLRWSA